MSFPVNYDYHEFHSMVNNQEYNKLEIGPGEKPVCIVGPVTFIDTRDVHNKLRNRVVGRSRASGAPGAPRASGFKFINDSNDRFFINMS